jgi:hypothetical protein
MAIVPLMVPVTLLGYSVAIGFGDESLLALRRCSGMRLGIENEFARLKSSGTMVSGRRCMVKRRDEDLRVVLRNEGNFPSLLAKTRHRRQIFTSYVSSGRQSGLHEISLELQFR